MSGESPAIVVAPDDRILRCQRCDRRIVVCAFCQDEECRHVVCYRCLREQLRQSLASPHAHGG
jgi:hypothetical protein